MGLTIGFSTGLRIALASTFLGLHYCFGTLGMDVYAPCGGDGGHVSLIHAGGGGITGTSSLIFSFFNGSG